MTFSARKATRIFIPALCILAAAGVILVASAHSGSAAGPANPSARLLSQFSIFNRTASAADTLPTDAGPEPATAQLARSIATRSSDLSQWATLNGNEGCVVIEGTAPGAEGAPSACTNLEAATVASELLTIAAGSSNQPYARKIPATIIAGLAPDGVDSVTITLGNGASDTVPVVENGFHLLTGGSNPVAYEWTSADGTKHVQDLKGN